MKVKIRKYALLLLAFGMMVLSLAWAVFVSVQIFLI